MSFAAPTPEEIAQFAAARAHARQERIDRVRALRDRGCGCWLCDNAHLTCPHDGPAQCAFPEPYLSIDDVLTLPIADMRYPYGSTMVWPGIHNRWARARGLPGVWDAAEPDCISHIHQRGEGWRRPLTRLWWFDPVNGELHTACIMLDAIMSAAQWNAMPTGLRRMIPRRLVPQGVLQRLPPELFAPELLDGPLQ